jgi:pilus assembly protein CpaE
LVRHLRRSARWTSLPVIMVTVRSAPEDYALSYEVGADEYFLKPIEPPKILAATRGLITRHEMQVTRGDGGGSVRGGSVTVAPTLSDRGKIITVFSLKGGVGTTTVAVNMAIAIKQLAPSSRVGIIDLSLEEGAAALLLDIIPTSTIAEWAREDLRDATPFLLNQYFVPHRSGVGLMAAPPSPEQAEMVRPDTVRKTLELAPQAFDYVLVDTASTFSENSLVALEAADTIILPLMPEMTALKSTASTMRILSAVNIPPEKLRLVLNEIIPHAGLTKSQVETSLGAGVTTIPHSGPDFVSAANQGQPLVTAVPTAAASRAIIEMAETLCVPEVMDVPADSKVRSNLLTRLERLRRT